MQKKLGILILALTSLVVTSCGCSVKRPSSNSSDSRDEPNPSVEPSIDPIDPISSETPPDSGEQHIHTFNESTWSNDDQYHWHDSTCGHDVVKDKAAHEFGDWHIAKDPTPTEEGLKYHECMVCGYAAYESIPATGEQTHVHEWSSEWSVDETYHWHACTGCSEVKDKAEHNLGTPGMDIMTGERSAFCSICRKNIVLSPYPCTITWKNYDGQTLEIDENAMTGTMPSYDGETPTKPSDSDYDYVFAGWTPSVKVIIEDTTYTATFNAVPKGSHTHNYVKDPDTLEYVCSCGEKNGRDYELSVTAPQLHVGDICTLRDGYSYSFKNDDSALAFGYVGYRIGSQNFTYDHGAGEPFPASLEGQNITMYVYVGVYSETNIKYEGSSSSTKLANVDVYVNSQLASKGGRVNHSYWRTAITPNLPTEYFFVYQINLGQLLPSGTPDLKPWPTSDVNAAFTAIGLAPFALPQLQDAAITSYDVHVYSGNNGFYIAFYGLKNTGDPDYTVNFYASRLPSLGFTKIDNFQYLSPDSTFTVYVASTIGANEQILDIMLYESGPKYTVEWQNYDGTVLETDSNLSSFASASYNGSTPSRPNDSNYVYYFKEWVLHSISSDGLTKVYRASYESSIFKFTNEGSYFEVHALLNKDYAGAAVIPASFLGKPVKSIADNALKDAKNVTSLSIPSSVESIGTSILAGMTSLQSLTVPFVGPNLNPSAADALFGYFFGSTAATGLVETTQYYNSVSSKTKYIPSSLTNVTVLAGTLGYGAFDNCKNISLITLPGVTKVDDYCFSDCSALQTVNFGDSALKEVGDHAFYRSGIVNLTLPNSVEKIESRICQECTSLKTFTAMNADKNLDTVGWWLFDGCSALESVALPVNGYFGKLFSQDSYSGSYEVSIGDGTEIYYYPSSLKTVKATGGIIDTGVFEGLEITTLEITESVASIQPASLAGLATIVNLSIPWVGCTPDATEINSNTQFGAIFGTSKWSNTACYSAQAFTNISGGANSIIYYLPKTLKNVTVTGDYPVFRAGFDHCEQIESITFTQGLDYVPTYFFRYCEGAKVISVGTPTDIDNYSFQHCESLLEAPLYEGLTHLGVHAFSYCSSLTAVTVPSTVTRFGASGEGSGSQFASCTSLQSASVLCSLTDSYMFDGCSSLTTVNMSSSITLYEQNMFEQTGLVTFTVPEGVTEIRGYCFQKITTLTTINLPSTLTKIGNTCFSGCTSLTNINFAGTMAQWNAVTKNSGWKNNVPATFVTCSDGTVYL